MKKAMIAAGISVLAILILSGLVGGFHHVVFVRYTPLGEAEFVSDLDFVPDLSPTLFGTYQSTIIPFVLYCRGELDGDGQVTIQTEHGNDPRYGYDALSYLEFTNLAVISAGKTTTLITENDPVRVFVNTERWATRLQQLGVCNGEEVEIEASGVAVTKNGERFDFQQNRRWKKFRATRWDIGILNGP